MKAKVIKTGEIVEVYHESQHGQITNIYKESVLVNGRMWSEDELDFCSKANEAPEKIYLLPRQGGDYAPYWRTDSQDDFGIEYTRTDTFIEKACEWLSNAFHKNRDGTFNYVGGNDCSIEDIINVFKKAQKG